MAMILISLGDCLILPLANGKFAYGQYLYYQKGPDGYGCLVKIYDIITNVEVQVAELQRLAEMFPPVFVGLFASIRSKRWRVIGKLPVENFSFPKFRVTNGFKPGE